MRFSKKNGAFTLIEVLIASALTVAITVGVSVAINTVLDYKKNAGTKEKLAPEVYVLLNDVENSFLSRPFSSGSLFIDGISYPVHFKKDYPSLNDSALSFFINTKEGIQLISYACHDLPNALKSGSSDEIQKGFYKVTKTVSDSKSIFEAFTSGSDLCSNFLEAEFSDLTNLVSDDVIFIKANLLKIGDDGVSMEYVDLPDSAFLIYAGSVYCGGSTASFDHFDFLEVILGSLPKSMHESYLAATTSEKEMMIKKYGFQLSRLISLKI